MDDITVPAENLLDKLDIPTSTYQSVDSSGYPIDQQSSSSALVQSIDTPFSDKLELNNILPRVTKDFTDLDMYQQRLAYRDQPQSDYPIWSHAKALTQGVLRELGTTISGFGVTSLSNLEHLSDQSLAAYQRLLYAQEDGTTYPDMDIDEYLVNEEVSIYKALPNETPKIIPTGKTVKQVLDSAIKNAETLKNIYDFFTIESVEHSPNREYLIAALSNASLDNKAKFVDAIKQIVENGKTLKGYTDFMKAIGSFVIDSAYELSLDTTKLLLGASELYSEMIGQAGFMGVASSLTRGLSFGARIAGSATSLKARALLNVIKSRAPLTSEAIKTSEYLAYFSAITDSWGGHRFLGAAKKSSERVSGLTPKKDIVENLAKKGITDKDLVKEAIKKQHTKEAAIAKTKVYKDTPLINLAASIKDQGKEGALTFLPSAAQTVAEDSLYRDSLVFDNALTGGALGSLTASTVGSTRTLVNTAKVGREALLASYGLTNSEYAQSRASKKASKRKQAEDALDTLQTVERLEAVVDDIVANPDSYSQERVDALITAILNSVNEDNTQNRALLDTAFQILTSRISEIESIRNRYNSLKEGSAFINVQTDAYSFLINYDSTKYYTLSTTEPNKLALVNLATNRLTYFKSDINPTIQEYYNTLRSQPTNKVDIQANYDGSSSTVLTATDPIVINGLGEQSVFTLFGDGSSLIYINRIIDDAHIPNQRIRVDLDGNVIDSSAWDRTLNKYIPSSVSVKEQANIKYIADAHRRIYETKDSSTIKDSKDNIDVNLKEIASEYVTKSKQLEVASAIYNKVREAYVDTAYNDQSSIEVAQQSFILNEALTKVYDDNPLTKEEFDSLLYSINKAPETISIDDLTAILESKHIPNTLKDTAQTLISVKKRLSEVRTDILDGVDPIFKGLNQHLKSFSESTNPQERLLVLQRVRNFLHSHTNKLANYLDAYNNVVAGKESIKLANGYIINIGSKNLIGAISEEVKLIRDTYAYMLDSDSSKSTSDISGSVDYSHSDIDSKSSTESSTSSQPISTPSSTTTSDTNTDEWIQRADSLVSQTNKSLNATNNQSTNYYITRNTDSKETQALHVSDDGSSINIYSSRRPNAFLQHNVDTGEIKLSTSLAQPANATILRDLKSTKVPKTAYAEYAFNGSPNEILSTTRPLKIKGLEDTPTLQLFGDGSSLVTLSHLKENVRQPIAQVKFDSDNNITQAFRFNPKTNKFSQATDSSSIIDLAKRLHEVYKRTYTRDGHLTEIARKRIQEANTQQNKQSTAQTQQPQPQPRVQPRTQQRDKAVTSENKRPSNKTLATKNLFDSKRTDRVFGTSKENLSGDGLYTLKTKNYGKDVTYTHKLNDNKVYVTSDNKTKEAAKNSQAKLLARSNELRDAYITRQKGFVSKTKDNKSYTPSSLKILKSGTLNDGTYKFRLYDDGTVILSDSKRVYSIAPNGQVRSRSLTQSKWKQLNTQQTAIRTLAKNLLQNATNTFKDLGSSKDARKLLSDSKIYTTKKQVDSASNSTMIDYLSRISLVKDSQEHTEHLTKLSKDILDKLQDKITVHLGESLLTETVGLLRKEDVYIINQKHNKQTPPNSSLLNLARMSASEVYCHELVHLITRRGISTNARLHKQLDALWAQARDVITVKDMLLDPNMDEKHPSYKASMQAAQSRYSYIFEPARISKDNTSPHLYEFVAFGMTNAAFMQALDKKLQVKNQKVKSDDSVNKTFNEKLTQFFNSCLDFIKSLFDKKQDKSGLENLRNIVEELSAIETKYRQKVNESSIFTTLNDLTNKADDKLSQLLKDNLSNITESYKDPDSLATKAKTAMGHLIDKNPALKSFLKDVYKEGLGVYASPIEFYNLKRHISHDVHTTRNQLLSDVSKGFHEAFKKEEITDFSKEALTYTVLRTDLRALDKDLNKTKDYLKSSSARRQLITNIKAILSAAFSDEPETYKHWFNQAEALGYYLATNNVRVKNLMLNANNILMLLGTYIDSPKLAKAGDTQLSTLYKQIDKLITLHALEYTNDRYLKETLRLMNDSEGFSYVNSLVNLLHSQNDPLAKSDSTIMKYVKGYIPEINTNNVSHVIDSPQLAKQYARQGYSILPIKPKYDKADPFMKATDVIYINTDSPQNTIMAGLLTSGVENFKGSTLRSKMFSQLNISPRLLRDYGNNYIRELSTIVGDSSIKDKKGKLHDNNYMLPILGEDGSIYDYRYNHNETIYNAYTMPERSFTQLAGTLLGSNVTALAASEYNQNILSELHKLYESRSNNPETNWVHINIDDIRINKLDAASRAHAYSLFGETVAVPAELHDLIFGFERYSLTDIFRKESQDLNTFEKLVDSSTTALFGDNAFKFVRKAEETLNTIALSLKDLITVKLGKASYSNLVSNVFQLLQIGVSPTEIFNGYKNVWIDIHAYRKDLHKLNTIRIKLSNPKLGLKEKTRLQEDVNRYEYNISMNPVSKFVSQGLLTTIVNDVSLTVDRNSISDRLEKIFNTTILSDTSSKLNKDVRGLLSNLFVLKGSNTYQMMSDFAQFPDFASRIIAYKKYVNDGLSSEDSFAKAMNIFIDYDLHTNKGLDYVNYVGFMMFTKYFIRIQRIIKDLSLDHPYRTLLTLLFKNMLINVPSILDSTAILSTNPINRLANPASSLDSLLKKNTVNTMLF